MKNYYEKKVLVVKNLIKLNKKRITDTEIRDEATKIGIPFSSAKTAWLTFSETGGLRVDGRQKTADGKNSFSAIPSHTCTARKDKTVTVNYAAEIILQYIGTKLTSREICSVHEVSINQFYDWLKELNVSGTLLGHKILDPTKYAKLDVKLAIWTMKYPNTKREGFDKMPELERAAYVRFSQVLAKYLRELVRK